ncbi:MAG: hypothetical protein AB7S77_02065 [Desulfatirhabdiaceae bacterium]
MFLKYRKQTDNVEKNSKPTAVFTTLALASTPASGIGSGSGMATTLIK